MVPSDQAHRRTDRPYRPNGLSDVDGTGLVERYLIMDGEQWIGSCQG